MKIQSFVISALTGIVLGLGSNPSRAAKWEAKEMLREWVEISSGTSNIEGVNLVQERVAAYLQELGFKVEYKPDPAGQTGKLLVANRAGKSSRKVTFVFHSDTVFETSSPFKGFKEDAATGRATGPGIIDEKGGIVVGLFALRGFLAAQPEPKFGLQVVVSPSEETGSNSFHPDFERFSKESFLILGFEPSLEDGSVIHSRRGNLWYEIKVKGREAHAGRAHKEGINACVELAGIIDRISKLTDYSRDLTISVGHIAGGQDKFNIVCGSAEAKVDLRFSDMRNRNLAKTRIERELKQARIRAASDGKQAEISFQIANDSKPFAKNPESVQVLQKILAEISREEGRKVEAKPSGGSSDLNEFWRPGVAIVDGLGAVGGKMHTAEEYIELSSLNTRARALVHYLVKLQ